MVYKNSVPFYLGLLTFCLLTSIPALSQSAKKDSVTKFPQGFDTAISEKECGDSFVRIFVKFSVNERGKITDVKIKKVINNGYSKRIIKDLKSESLRVVAAMPDWAPQTTDGKPIKVYFLLPMKYCLK